MQTVRRKVIYHGRVQGVGFRATVSSIVKKFAVTGYVRNLPDGTVELVIDGAVSEVEGLILAVGDRMSRYITDAEITDLHDDEPLGDFRVR